MKNIILILFISAFSQAQSYTGSNAPINQKEQLDRAIEQNRKEINNTVSPNTKSTTPQLGNLGIDPNLKIDLDSSLMGLYLNEGESGYTGFKISRFASFSMFKEIGGDKSRLQAGFEIPGDVDRNGMSWVFGSGVQLNSKNEKPKLTFYFDGGIDHHFYSRLKAQYMLQYVLGGNLGLMVGLGLSF